VSAMKNINLPQLKDKVLDLPNTFKDLKFWPANSSHPFLPSTSSDRHQITQSYYNSKWICTSVSVLLIVSAFADRCQSLIVVQSENKS
jgi:hypothetical protein